MEFPVVFNLPPIEEIAQKEPEIPLPKELENIRKSWNTETIANLSSFLSKLSNGSKQRREQTKPDVIDIALKYGEKTIKNLLSAADTKDKWETRWNESLFRANGSTFKDEILKTMDILVPIFPEEMWNKIRINNPNLPLVYCQLNHTLLPRLKRTEDIIQAEMDHYVGCKQGVTKNRGWLKTKPLKLLEVRYG